MLVPVLVAIVLVGGGFYGGMKYQQSKTPVRGTGTFAGATSRTRAGGAGGTAFNGTFGQVLSKSANSITVQLADGSSRIVFISATTPVEKQTTGTLTDVAVGTNIAVTGTSNSDGSVIASQIQIRPAGTLRPSPTP